MTKLMRDGLGLMCVAAIFLIVGVLTGDQLGSVLMAGAALLAIGGLTAVAVGVTRTR